MDSLTILGETYNSGDRILFNVVDDFLWTWGGHIIKNIQGYCLVRQLIGWEKQKKYGQ